jgi:myo-inositol-1(or 4)-monophosphatase
MTSSALSSLDRHLRLLLEKVGAFTAREFRRFSDARIEYKGERNPFTYVDVKAEEMLREACGTLIPGSGFIGEELAGSRSENGFEWIIDPVDGTVNFIHGIPHYAISLALSLEGELELGYVYEPVNRQLFRALRGQGATLNGRRLRVSAKGELGAAVVATGFPYDLGGKGEQHFQMIRKVVGSAHGLRRFGSAALDLAYVAAGRYEAFFEYNLQPWDVAAGLLLVREAGGRVTDFFDREASPSQKEFLASNGLLHPALLALAQEAINGGT